MKRKFGALLFALLFALVCAAPAFALTIPDPPENSWVLDKAGVLSQKTINCIDNHLAVLKDETGAEMAIVTLDFANADLEDLCYGIINEWGVGSDTRNNGVVILFSVGDDDYYITQGYGIEKVLDSGTLRLIIDEYTEPKFAVQDYDGAMADTVCAIYNVLADYYNINTISSVYDLTRPTGNSYIEGSDNSGGGYYDSSTDDFFSMLLGFILFILIIRFLLWIPFAGRTKYWAWWLFMPGRWRRRHPGWSRSNRYTSYGPSYHWSPPSSSYRPPSSSYRPGSFHSNGGYTSHSSSSYSSHSSSSHSYSSHSSSSHGGFSGGGGHGGGAGRGR